jgi:DNA-binding HxlR family transcriptional regulator
MLRHNCLQELKRFGPRKFQEFSSNTLSARLKRLEEAEIERRFYEQHPPRAEYLLTERGKELIPVLNALFAWGQRHTKCAPAAKKQRSLPATQAKRRLGRTRVRVKRPCGWTSAEGDRAQVRVTPYEEASLFIEFRRMTASVARWLIVVDPELGVLLLHNAGDFLYRCDR